MPVLKQSLGKRSLPVLRFASCEAVVNAGGRGRAVGRTPLLALRAWMNPVDEGGLPMPREPALLTSAGRMPERSQHRVSEGRMP
jgi:hypothetical protein